MTKENIKSSVNMKKYALFSTAAALALAGGVVLSSQTSIITNAASILGVHQASAMGTDSIEWNKEGISQKNTVNISVPTNSVGGYTSWGISGDTKVMKADGSGPAPALSYNSDGTGWRWGVNQPKSPLPVYSIEPGSSYRITNAGKTNDGKSFDLIYTVKSTTNKHKYPSKPGISITDSANLGTKGDSFHSIALLVTGVDSINAHVDYVKSGTNDKLNVTTGTYWSDIDVRQGINENQSNSHVIFGGVDDHNTNKMAVDGKTVYSTTDDDFTGMNDPDHGAYIGVGSGTGYDVNYYSPYLKGLNANYDMSDWYVLGFRYDLFGRFDNIKFPNQLKNPKKTVTDTDEKDSSKNTVGIKERKQHYNVSVETGNGNFTKLTMSDTLPQGFKTDTGRIKVTNKAGKDVTGLFNISLDGQKLSVVGKDTALTSKDLQNTTVTVGIDGDLTSEWGPSDLKNNAVWNDGKDHPTGDVHSYVPSKPTAKKEVSVDSGKTYNKADTPESAATLQSQANDYTWKNTFTLSNHTNFNKVVFTDHLENIQKLDKSKVHVYDWNGADVTKNGAITTKANGDKTDVVWTANANYVAAINKAFGRDSDKQPGFTYSITANIKDATSEQEAKYWDKDKKQVIIPNQSTVTEGDASGEVNTDTNKSHVKTPTPTAPNAKKQVAKEGTDPTKETGWANTLQLSNHDQKYSYRTTFNLSKNYNFEAGSLVLTDHFENLQSFKSVKIIDAQGKDISNKFDIKQTKKDAKTDIVATVKGASANDFDFKGDTIYMVIDGATLEGATGVQELNYQEPHTKESGAKTDDANFATNPFKEGITIPNISAIDELSSLPGNKYHKDTNRTFVNIVVNPSLEKYVESDNDSASILDPNDAKDASDKKSDSNKDSEKDTNKDNSKDDTTKTDSDSDNADVDKVSVK